MGATTQDIGTSVPHCGITNCGNFGVVQYITLNFFYVINFGFNKGNMKLKSSTYLGLTSIPDHHSFANQSLLHNI